MFNMIPDPSRKSLKLRLTDHYVGNCRHMDDWNWIGTIDTLHVKNRENDFGDDGNTFYVFLVHTKETDENVISKALIDTFTSVGCNHEHDCCGCISNRGRNTRKLGPQLWALNVGWSRNI